MPESARGVSRIANKPRKSRNVKQTRSELGILRRKGLYKAKRPRAKLTRYALGLLRKFRDVITGKASVVNVGSMESAKRLRTGETTGTVRTKGRLAVVPSQGDERVRYSKKTGRIIATRKIGGARYTRETFAHRPRTLKETLKSLKPGDRIAVPMYRGVKGVEWTQYTPDEFSNFWNQYGARGQSRTKTGQFHRYHDLLSHIQIARYSEPGSKRNVNNGGITRADTGVRKRATNKRKTTKRVSRSKKGRKT